GHLDVTPRRSCSTSTLRPREESRRADRNPPPVRLGGTGLRLREHELGWRADRAHEGLRDGGLVRTAACAGERARHPDPGHRRGQWRSNAGTNGGPAAPHAGAELADRSNARVSLSTVTP